MNPRQLPARHESSSSDSATQLSILMSAAKDVIDEEFKRSERLDAKSRNQVSVTGAFFAVVQAGVIGLVNGGLRDASTGHVSAFVPWLAIAGGVAGVAMILAVALSYAAWRLRDDNALGMATIRQYIEPARAGNPGVGVHLVTAYAKIADDRRHVNRIRADALDRAAIACGAALGFVGIELSLAFVALAVQ
jgi:hypothetical protein